MHLNFCRVVFDGLRGMLYDNELPKCWLGVHEKRNDAYEKACATVSAAFIPWKETSLIIERNNQTSI